MSLRHAESVSMSIKHYFVRLLWILKLYTENQIPKSLAAGFFTVSSLLSFFSGQQEIAVDNLVREVTDVIAAVEEQSDYSPKGLGEHYRIIGEIQYVVREGDNIYIVANTMKRDDVWIKPKQIIEWNNLTPPHYYLEPGTTLTLYNLAWEPQLVEASWYGPGFNGKPMANTKIFNQNDIVAAHMYMPLGMTVRVTNIANGKFLEVPITDRGNFEKYNRGIDLSKQAAKILGYHNAGTAQVLVEPLP
jgi:hypothetical protein